MTEKLDNRLGSVFAPIRLERVADKVASQLKKAISQGIFKVGDRLPSERELADQMGVSRPSVREAIQQLALLGILDTVHGGGSVVKNLTEQEIQRPIELIFAEDTQRVLELTEIRLFMEAWAVRKAAKNRTSADLDQMHRCLEQMEDDFAKGINRFELDLMFHNAIASATHNVIYLHFINSVYGLINYSIKIHRERVLYGRQDQMRILKDHRKIYDAIGDRDPDAAEAAIKDHLGFVVREFKKRFPPE
jgi:GntR family transcriptional regulator, transcriptional repressor for pyruvate dehydrogenase complex